MAPEPELRRAARLVDQQKRIFLFQYEDDGRNWWTTPGGGLEGDETFEEAATREAMEELSLAGVALFPLWRQTVDFTFRSRRIHQVEQYFLVRPPQQDGSLRHVVGAAHRRESIVAGRWWSAEELETTSEQVFPEDLRERLAELPVEQSLTVGMILFPNLTQLDLTGPYEVFARLPGTKVHLVASSSTPVRSERGLTISPDTTFENAPALDVICVPGGPGVDALMEDEVVLRFLRARAPGARYVTSVCTGALVLGAAGLLQGYRATTHWLSQDLLALFGAEPADGRVVIDRNRITGGGVTAGIDFGLTVAAEMFGPAVAQEVQLMLEYSPAPPFSGGSPQTAPAGVVRTVIDARAAAQARRRAIAERAAARLRKD